ncbi:uncharacterized protein EDB93DRAFT_1161365 [Suillus bovinus]|uniref:uncharacterized protein n=1 Tax=Suillus bovinus TaxID=48563 RepID=UPI001B868A39|nr:uncharacterized protein EDB93DRAFT_1161365 [Suillus bovinus]KAG2140477.1 hypothetical protein EDB93DRAFT_1161365 [Suillus bovinus]
MRFTFLTVIVVLTTSITFVVDATCQAEGQPCNTPAECCLTQDLHSMSCPLGLVTSVGWYSCMHSVGGRKELALWQLAEWQTLPYYFMKSAKCSDILRLLLVNLLMLKVRRYPTLMHSLG